MKENKELQVFDFFFRLTIDFCLILINQISSLHNMLNQTEILNYLRENKEIFRVNYGINKIGLFGSYARGQQNEQSDIDILIEMASDTENILDKRLQLMDLLMNHFSKNVDICHEQAIKQVFRDLVLSEAIYA